MQTSQMLLVSHKNLQWHASVIPPGSVKTVTSPAPVSILAPFPATMEPKVTVAAPARISTTARTANFAIPVTTNHVPVVSVIPTAIATTHVPTMGSVMSVDVASVTSGISVKLATAPAMAEGSASRMALAAAMPASLAIDASYLC